MKRQHSADCIAPSLDADALPPQFPKCHEEIGQVLCSQSHQVQFNERDKPVLAAVSGPDGGRKMKGRGIS
jgi:hypothetical protein